MRNPPWYTDELLVTLDFYLSNARPISQPFPSKGSHEILELSQLLNSMWERLGGEKLPTFRNPNGIYMKLMNFRSIDPEHPGQGLGSYSRLDEFVFKKFSTNLESLRSLAKSIRETVFSQESLPDSGDLMSDSEEGQEGRVLTRLHHQRERNSKLVDRKKQEVRKATGKLTCEVCEFDFAEAYGERGEGFIECHHTRPLSELSPTGTTTRLSDLALVCSNCHRMIHRHSPWLSIELLRGILTH